MVVLDGHNMLGTGPNQYLQPDYLSPLPTMLDAKKSPLALLAQTCSQIGADSPNTKSLLPSMDSSKRKSSTSSESSSINFSTTAEPGQKSDRESVPRPRSSSGGASSTGSAEMKPTALPANTKSPSASSGGKSSPAFKPYESVPVSSSKAQREENTRKPTPELQQQQQHHEKSRTPSKRPASISPNEIPSAAKHPRKSPQGSDKKSSSGASSSDDGKSSPKSNNNDQGASPIIRSGLEVLHGHGLSKDAFGKPGSSALSSLGALASHYPAGFDPTNPATRPPFFAPPSAHHFMGGGYPPAGLGGPGSPYPVSYTRVKTPSGAETIVPVCKDPYCTGCSLSMPGLMANAAAFAAAAGFPGFMPPGAPGAGGICPAGCAQCDHQKFSIPGFPGFFSPGMGMPPTSSAGYPASLLSQHAQAQAAAAAAQQQHAQRPYVCNWIAAESYCGKRFPSSEELLQHLRTHTNNMSTSEANNLSAMTSPGSLYSSALLSSQMSAAAAAMHRTYPTPPLSPLSAARYNPFGAPPGKPGGFGIPTTMSSLVPHPQSLANYYSSMSPYALYGQRIGPPVHP